MNSNQFIQIAIYSYNKEPFAFLCKCVNKYICTFNFCKSVLLGFPRHN